VAAAERGYKDSSAAAAAAERRLQTLEAQFVRARDDAARLELEMVGAVPSSILTATRAEVERLERRIEGMVPKLQLEAGKSIITPALSESLLSLATCFPK
jgi:hypothetical protein